jgi:hypothetical protein
MEYTYRSRPHSDVEKLLGGSATRASVLASMRLRKALGSVPSAALENILVFTCLVISYFVGVIEEFATCMRLKSCDSLIHWVKKKRK